ncbi:MFS transporter [Mycolicibacterium goodii]|uniref:MFS transporter n=1 Tax=Mycolicibacterium goodii TaxID=134601 RepID=A0ABS6HGB9_MYCGD|nr:MFS transporter [Mycolicibacterium goodii]MBU8809373.1 MFS transporter [Mycolicibacterium goodii]MBU8816580.1 MFS transporter [Mycolicibacterium goodii]MBU8821729.1 MFS transporter [Mycolicibacterium goodii]MBU8831693.1 MFS transporter [Mycolicibacterium goodii]MBU8836721.1 MFS transporter [Mycolicibacterium goodii]
MNTVSARHGRILTLGASHAATDFYQGSVAVLVPVLVLQADFTALQATTVVLAATVGSALAQPLFGALADRFQTFWLLPVSMLLAGTGIGVLGIVGSFGWTLAAAAGSGLGVAAYHPAAARLARQAGGGTAKSMSWFIAGGNIGLALAPAVAAPILVTFGPYGSPLLALPGVLGGLALVAARRWLLACSPGGTRKRHQAAATDDWRSFGLLAAVAILRSGAYFGISTIVGLLVVDELGGGTALAATLLGIFLGIGVVATLAGGVLADRWRRVDCMRLGFAITVPGLLITALAPNVATAAAGVVVAGIGVFLPFSVQTTLGHEYLPHHIGTASGVTIGLSVSAGGALAPLLGLITESHGPRSALLVLTTLPTAALLLSMRLGERDGIAQARAAAPPR